ncbi:DNA primase [Mycobacterium phage Phlei]|uniref:Zinc finger CHC2-type domain-containing protein n=1 Tax=Mycobacterium phage Phlei TaxID=1690684 RepID=A0A0N9BDN1_9CAUD|nr:DNA primase [Mycobacterium phage Phlei]ALA48163.1 hypothetical protein [Mycobacterium phage Phlei]
MTDSYIAKVILRYYPEWEPPADTREWNPCLCPFHGESNPSAAVSYDYQAFRCMACGVKGDAISLIRHEEEVTFAEAKRIAEEIAVGSGIAVPGKSARKSSRRVFGQPGTGSRGDQPVRTWVRGRTTPWS